MGRMLRKITPAGRRLEAAMRAADNMRGKVGWFESAQYPDGLPVAYVATIHEFGYPEGNIPPRPTGRPTVAEHAQAWASLMGSGVKVIVRGGYTFEQVLDGLCLQAQGDWARTIANLTAPALKPQTIAARQRRYKDRSTVGSLDKPLVDTSLMVSSLTYQIEQRPEQRQLSLFSEGQFKGYAA